MSTFLTPTKTNGTLGHAERGNEKRFLYCVLYCKPKKKEVKFCALASNSSRVYSSRFPVLPLVGRFIRHEAEICVPKEICDVDVQDLVLERNKGEVDQL